MTPSHRETRQYLVDELRKDLIGPSAPDEELTDRPLTHYLAGILFPPNTEAGAEQDDSANEAPQDDDDEVDVGTLIATTNNPSSIGLTFMIRSEEHILIRVRAAHYSLQTSARTPTNSTWQRRELDIPAREIDASHPGINREQVIPGVDLYLYWRIRDRGDVRVITVSLINMMQVSPGSEEYDAACFFQPQIEVTSVESGRPVFLADTHTFSGLQDPDHELNDLLYRHAAEFAVGHGCAVDWNPKTEGQAAVVRTVIMPGYEVQQMSPDLTPPLKAQQMKFLAISDQDSLINELQELPQRYRQWINIQQMALETLPDTQKAVAQDNLKQCLVAAARMEQGIQVIASNKEACRAFEMANQAMLIQRSRLQWKKEPAETRKEYPDLLDNALWRPFQLAFILMCLPSIVEPQDSTRSLVDLLWFPTGGGKTEAYLGLTAFTIFLRRLCARDKKVAAGVTVLMRYTLRLLTLQQFERAASLIVACESLRRNDPKNLGNEPINLGLWVGGGATPNTFRQAQDALKKLLNGETPTENGDPCQITSCPWCGTKLTPRDYHCNPVGKTLLIICPNTKCDFHSGLPLYVVDDDIYRVRPTLLIGTVDKFARLPWKAETSALFGLSNPRNLPPELIIQDELHLISGPLGTMVGLYETAIDALCEHNGIVPKVIASTATIRRAQEQCMGIFGRGMSQFPPPGLDSRDSFFAKQVPSEEKPGRIFVGVYAPGKSMKTTLLRVYALLLQRIHDHMSGDELRDPYWTLVGYFNSLRELGGAVRLVDDDVRARMQMLAHSQGSNPREITSDELTSRISQREVRNLLDRMAVPLGKPGVLDVLLATNMISVGVDVDRLGLMVVNGQPKMSSEYIQATSRIGRMFPGLVVTIYSWTRPRDRSHYERFVDYHAAIYRHVEPSSVTPFASRSRDRALHSVFIALMRHFDRTLTPETAAARFDPASQSVESAIQMIQKRVIQVDPGEAEETLQQLQQIISRWHILADQYGEMTYGQDNGNDNPRLMISAEKYHDVDSLVFPTLQSLRGVEGMSDLFPMKSTKKTVKDGNL